jgi:hypothetical protein
MPEHITEWLGAYLDEELRGARLQQVENHLSECATCQMEFDELRGLSGLLREALPPADFLPRERFIANLTLSLPRQNGTTQTPRAAELGWWMIPIGIIVAWIFMQLSATISTVLLAAVSLGLLDEGLSWLWGGAARQTIWFMQLVDIFLGSALNLTLVNDIALFLHNLVFHYFWQAILGLAYLAWLVHAWQKQATNSGNLSRA